MKKTVLNTLCLSLSICMFFSTQVFAKTIITSDYTGLFDQRGKPVKQMNSWSLEIEKIQNDKVLFVLKNSNSPDWEEIIGDQNGYNLEELRKARSHFKHTSMAWGADIAVGTVSGLFLGTMTGVAGAVIAVPLLQLGGTVLGYGIVAAGALGGGKVGYKIASWDFLGAKTQKNLNNEKAQNLKEKIINPNDEDVSLVLRDKDVMQFRGELETTLEWIEKKLR